MSTTPISDIYGPTGSGSAPGNHPTMGAAYGSMPATGLNAANRWNTVGLGVITAMLVFGVTLSILMAFAGPSASPPSGPRAPVTAAPSTAPTPRVGLEPGPTSSVARSAVDPATIPSAATTHGELVIKAQPASAQVTVNGRSMGNAPFEGVLEVGMHEITVKASGHQAWESTVEIVRGERQTLNVVLTSEDSASSVAVSGRRRPRRTSRRSEPADPHPTSQPPDDSSPAPATRKLDREDSGFKKLGRSESGFKKLGQDEPKVEKLH